MHQNAGVDSNFRVVDAPLDLRFALVWDEFQHRVRQFRTELRHQSSVVCRTTAIEEAVQAPLFEMTEPPGGGDTR